MASNEHVVNIIKRDDSKSPFLDHEKLKELLINTKAANIPVAFYSICGSARLGKSFLWNQFVRYLKDNNLFLRNLDSTQNLEAFFEWKAGDERHTDGILVYKQPFILRTINYEEIALFLMDTQGMFDDVESGKNNGMIFALSFLISSLQVLNIQSKLEATHLQYSYEAMKIVDTVRKCKPGIKPIQSMMFLVRDWRRKSSYDLGLAGGNKYITSLMKLKETQADDQRYVREEIENNFEKVSGFLLPEPGKTIVDMPPNNSICKVKDVDQKFYETAEELFQHLCNKGNIVVKTVDGEVLKGRDLYTYIVEVGNKITKFSAATEPFETFIEHDHRTTMRTLAFKFLSAYLVNICKEFKDCLKRHHEKINEKKQNIDELKINRSGLQQRHEDLKNTAIQEFREVPKPGGNELHNRWEKVLDALIEKNYNKFEDCVRSEKAFVNALKYYEGELRSSAQDISDRWRRIRHPKDEAKERSLNALEKAKGKISREVRNGFIAQQCIQKLEIKANILLGQHLVRIERIITGVVIGVSSVVIGLSVGAIVAVAEVPCIMALAGATEATTGLILKSAAVGTAVGVGAGIAAGTGTYHVTNYVSPVEQVIKMSWNKGGDDLKCIEAEVGVALCYGFVRFRMETDPTEACKEQSIDVSNETKCLEYVCYMNPNCVEPVLVWEIRDKSEDFTYSLDEDEIFKGTYLLENLGNSIRLKIKSCDEFVLPQPQEVVIATNALAYDEEFFRQYNFKIVNNGRESLRGKTFNYKIEGDSYDVSEDFSFPVVETAAQIEPVPLPSSLHSRGNEGRSETETKIIGQEGGRIEFKDFKQCYVDFPPEAVDKDVTFHITLRIGTTDKKSDDLILTPTLDCSPSMKFNKPVTISLPTCYKPDNSEVEVVPQTSHEDRWLDDNFIIHGGKDFIVFKTESFSRKRVRANRSSNGRHSFNTKTLQYICYQHPSVDQPCLTWCVQDKVNDFARKMKKGEAFRGMFVLRQNKSLTLSITCQENSSITIQPTSSPLNVIIDEECFWENNFRVRNNDADDNSMTMFEYYISHALGNIRNSSFPLHFPINSRMFDANSGNFLYQSSVQDSTIIMIA